MCMHSEWAECTHIFNEIMQKSGIDIIKHGEQANNGGLSPKGLSRKDTPAPSSDPAKFISGVEEDLNVAVDESDQ